MTIPGMRRRTWVDRLQGRELNSWGNNEELFWETGRAMVAMVVGKVAERSGQTRWHRALDFGCGIGRLTQALGAYADHVVGIDVSPTMIERAKAANRLGERCNYIVNSAAELDQLGSRSFDLVMSLITIQHLEEWLGRAMLQALADQVAPQGVLAVQVPVAQHAVGGGPALRHRIWSAATRTPTMEMHAYPESDVLELLHASGLEVLTVFDDRGVGDWGESRLFIAGRSN